MKGYYSEGFLQAGFQFLIDEILMQDNHDVKVNVLHFPDMRSLLCWSHNPQLAEGITVVSGNVRAVTCIQSWLNPDNIIVIDKGMSLGALRKAFAARLAIHKRAKHYRRKDILFSANEMIFIRRLLQGYPGKVGCKKHSYIRQCLMRKTESKNIVMLIIRLRLLFYMDQRYLLKEPRMRKMRVFSGSKELLVPQSSP